MIAALSYALDLTEGQPMGHSARCCALGMRIGAEIGLSLTELSDLYYALLIKDAGCSSNASRLFHIIAADEIRAKADVKTTDWTRVGWESLQYAVGHVAVGKPFMERVANLARVAVDRKADSAHLVKIRCERGASIARQIGFSEAVAAGVHSLDEHWNGGGYPDQLQGEAIPLFSRIALLTQTLEVFWRMAGARRAVEVLRERSKRWFDPALVQAVESLAAREALWTDLDSPALLEAVLSMEPLEVRVELSEERMDSICLAFAEVVDAKSPFTYRHSNGVAEAAQAIGRALGLAATDTKLLWRASLLHDIGKLSVPNSILEKPGKLNATEWELIMRHPFYSLEILRRIPGFGKLSEIAACHHERLDGKGYFRGYDRSRLDQPTRIVAVADVFDALAARRPYRDALPLETVFEIMQKDSPNALDPECLAALMTSMESSRHMGTSLVRLAVETQTVDSALARERVY